MVLEKITKLIFPSIIYKKIKVVYRKLRKRFHTKLTEKELVKILTEDLGIKLGSVVFIHSSIDNLFLDFEPEKVLDILLNIVGEEGTLLFPCNQIKERAEDYLNRGEIFNVKRTISKMGLLSGLAILNKKSIRSLHPTNSVVAIGKYAKELTEEHPDSIYPCGEKSPYYKIIHFNGIIVGLGVNTNSLTFTHVIEDLMKDKFPVQTRRRKIFQAAVIDKEGKNRIVETLVAHPNTGLRNVSGFIKKNIPKNICIDFKRKGIDFFKADSLSLLEKMKQLANNNITMYSKKAYTIKDKY
jgi:aminoglycoside 3-N-acetyltransferase